MQLYKNDVVLVLYEHHYATIYDDIHVIYTFNEYHTRGIIRRLTACSAAVLYIRLLVRLQLTEFRTFRRVDRNLIVFPVGCHTGLLSCCCTAVWCVKDTV